jgi:hypothetical protein
LADLRCDAERDLTEIDSLATDFRTTGQAEKRRPGQEFGQLAGGGRAAAVAPRWVIRRDTFAGYC